MKRVFSSIILLTLLACSGLQSPEFKKMENLKVRAMSILDGTKMTMEGDAVFYNPNPIGAKVKEIELDVFINDNLVNNVKNEVEVSVKGDADFSVPLEFEIPLEEVIGSFSIGDLFKEKLIEYKVSGTIKVALGAVTFDVPIEFEEKESIKLK